MVTSGVNGRGLHVAAIRFLPRHLPQFIRAVILIITMPELLPPNQIESFHDQGFLVLPGLFADEDLRRLDKAILRHAKQQTAAGGKRYPARGCQFTIIGSVMADPDLAFLAEHEAVVGAARQLLEAPPVLSAFVGYLKTPGAAGTSGDYERSSATAHCDYKTYQQAGSSLHWLFCIVPLVDLDEPTGQLFVSPGSHRLSRIEDGPHGIRRVIRASAAEIAPVEDTKLRRGDLLLMHGFTWHEGGPNRSDHDRYGIYNKYRAAHAPPAAGPNLFSNQSYEALSEAGRSLLPHHSDKTIGSCRLILEHEGRFLLYQAEGAKAWSLPGGAIGREDRKRGVVDQGNVVASLEDAAAQRIGLDLPWATYIGDYDEGAGLCRVYAHPVDEAPAAPAAAGTQTEWFTAQRLRQMSDDLAGGFEAAALDHWLDKRPIRGIGQSKRRAAPGRK